MRLLGALLLVQTALTATYATAQLGGFTWETVDLDREVNLTSWWGATLLAVAGVGSLAVAAGRFAAGTRWPWLAIGTGFLFLSLDETIQLHERVGSSVMGDRQGTDGLWVVAYLPLLVSGAAVLLLAARSVAPAARKLLLAGTGFMVAAVVAEAVSGRFHETLRHPLEVALEENAEMLGVGLVIVSVTLTLVAGIRGPAHETPETARGTDLQT